jgi:hypothetical protein
MSRFSFARDDTKVRVSVAARADVLRSWACSKEHEPDTLPGCLRYTSSPSIPTNTAYARDLTCHDLNGCAALSGRQCMNATRSLLQHTGGSLGGMAELASNYMHVPSPTKRELPSAAPPSQILCM